MSLIHCGSICFLLAFGLACGRSDSPRRDAGRTHSGDRASSIGSGDAHSSDPRDRATAPDPSGAGDEPPVVEGTMTMSDSGLMWAQCLQGQLFNESSRTCEGDAKTFMYCSENSSTCTGWAAGGDLDGSGQSEAWDTCDGLVLGGYGDWRVPTKDELKGLVVCTNGSQTPLADFEPCGEQGTFESPTLNQDNFPYTRATPLWSSTASLLMSRSSFAVDFFDGALRERGNHNQLHVKCVRDIE